MAAPRRAVLQTVMAPAAIGVPQLIPHIVLTDDFVVRAAAGQRVHETGRVDAWVGLVGVVAGALVAFGGQYLTRRAEMQERGEALLLEQFALLVALSEDYRNRVWEERTQVASDVVAAWDLGTYRLAEARLRVLSREPELLAALEVLHKKGTALGKAWRLAPKDEAGVEDAWVKHREAIERFVAASSQVMRGRAASGLRILSLGVRRDRSRQKGDSDLGHAD